MPMRTILLGFFAVLATGCGKPKSTAAAKDNQSIILKHVGFATPESVLHDAMTDVYYVSNINGSPLAEDDNGFISAVTIDGKVVDLKWIDGASDSVRLNAPKGMAVAEDILYVADINTIRKFDRRTGVPRGTVTIPGATFLNDITTDNSGAIYFTDTGMKAGPSGLEPSGTDAVYRFSPDGKLDTLARGPELGGPNGIALSGDSVWVVSFRSGELYRVANGGKTDVVKLPKGGLDGLVVFNGDVFTSSWDDQAIFRGPTTGPFVEAIAHLEAPADIGHDLWRHRLLIPLFNKNEVHILPLVP